jgi:carboxylesterase type B
VAIQLGGFGFLGGPTVESEGVPNVAFWDQRKALEWVQSYIGLLGGDKDSVTAMGESAGGGE